MVWRYEEMQSSECASTRVVVKARREERHPRRGEPTRDPGVLFLATKMVVVGFCERHGTTWVLRWEREREREK